jgi:hypothetical protein
MKVFDGNFRSNWRENTHKWCQYNRVYKPT